MRREAHCTYRAMRRLLLGGEQKEKAMPFPTSKCGRPGEGRFVPGGVVPVDERTRICGERSTTPDRRNSRLSLGAWCSSTKRQGFAGREAPRRAGGRTVRARGRGARGRKNKGLRGVKHHAEPEEETSVLPFRSVRARPRAAPPPDGIKKRSCYSSSATS